MNRPELSSAIFREIGIIQERVDFMLKKNLPENLPPVQFKVLNHLIYTTNKNETVSELANNSRVSLSAMSQIIKQLIAKGFVKLHVRSQDARQKTIEITNQGRKAHDKARKLVAVDMKPLVNAFTLDFLESLHSSLHEYRIQFENL
ncbi:hypothetical protein NBRC116493_13630 [Aurantivibrio infirmus]